MKLLYLFSLLVLVHSESEDETVEVTFTFDFDYTSMYNNECKNTTTTTTSTTTSSAPVPTTSPTPAPVHGWEKYEDKYANKYANKYENKYEGNGNPGSVSGNRMGGDNGNADNQQNAVFCKCLAEEKKSGKGYAASQNAFSKCMDKANGNNAKHWEKVAEKYANKFGGKHHLGNLPAITTTEGVETTAQTSKDEALFVDVDSDNNGSYGNAAFFVTFIGSSMLLFICAWFIKKSFKKWVSKDYDQIGNGNFNVVQNDECNAINFNRGNSRFAGWNKYSSV